MEALKNCARSIDSGNNKHYIVAVLIALIMVSLFLGSYYILLKPPAKEFTTIYLFDSQKQAVDYPEILIINQNNTFTLIVNVENHMGVSQECTVLMKITGEMIHKLPLLAEANATYTKTLENEATWEVPSTITITHSGTYSVIFELWLFNKEEGELEFTGNACYLNVEVINQS